MKLDKELNLQLEEFLKIETFQDYEDIIPRSNNSIINGFFGLMVSF